MKRFLFVSFCLIFISCNVDVENVKLTGYVYDSQSNVPIKDARLRIENWYYGNSPDQSYTGLIQVELVTNEKGFYSIELDTTACLMINISKNGYVNHFKSKDVFIRKQKIDFYLDKEK